jgi:outer membrane protein TolC
MSLRYFKSHVSGIVSLSLCLSFQFVASRPVWAVGLLPQPELMTSQDRANNLKSQKLNMSVLEQKSPIFEKAYNNHFSLDYALKSSQQPQRLAFRDKHRNRNESKNFTPETDKPSEAIFIPGENPETLNFLSEIRSKPWGLTPDKTQESSNAQHIGLSKVFQDTLAQSYSLRQAVLKIEDSPQKGSPTQEANANMLNWILPANTNSLKEAARLNTEASRAHVLVVKQKVLLESSKLYSDLCKAYLERYLASQSMDQSVRQLSAEEKRFQAGEIDHFDVTRLEMSLIDRYGRYLTADTAYASLSSALSGTLGYSVQQGASVPLPLVPEDLSWKDGDPGVPALPLFPEDITLEAVRRVAHLRPDLREANLKLEALDRLVKIAFGPEKEKRKVQQKQMELERDKGLQAANISIERSFNDFKLSQKTVTLAQQQALLSQRFVQQLQVSYKAGFSSVNELLDGQAQLLKARTALLSAQVAANQARIQLLYEMGQLSETSLTHPLQDTF